MYDRLEREFSQHHGCRLLGAIDVQRVPGNFHVGHHSFQDVVQHYEQLGMNIDTSFHIYHLSFGKQSDYNKMRRHFPSTGVSHPLDGFSRRPSYREAGSGKSVARKMRTNIFVEVIPAEFRDHADWTVGMLKTESFIMNVQHETDFEARENIIVVNYNISPISIQFSNARENIFQFLINVFAIIGGIFTVAGIFDSMLHRSFKVLFKADINKLA